ncbi:A/G-specific adenine glycosylase [Brevibacillus humidisoli]|uniref:A/G-specific adenine glycosylase n=1 Tax=Brevibacillus humidisoli TaxID=2895522 RepID=UPI001E351718|nr:A/G-specific adenine glycosylase [Brevibacillus humidisoli]UFJ41275.1 A/G-specific adenine glycosylase [Brevibacillus humidisoli]
MSKKEQTLSYKLPDEFEVFGFHRDLLAWYDQQKRDLPWRVNRDPYRIWVSEIMLQQTRVETVKPYYENFMAKFPTVEALADAPEDEVLKAWEGLGYYSRARNLQAAAREVKASYGGQLPDTREEIARLKGIGPYTAGAILSIAYDKPEPAVDGNVMRVFARLLLMEDDIAKPAVRKKFEQLVRQTIPAERAGDFNQALMELGAMVCQPRSPHCLTCPVFDYCLARREGVQEQLPVKGKAKPPRPVDLLVAVIRRGDRWLINKRPEQGLLAGLWEFPMFEPDRRYTDEEWLEEQTERRFGISIAVCHELPSVQHTFSHLQWNLHVFLCEWLEGEPPSDSVRLVSQDEWETYAFPVAHNKIIEHLVDAGHCSAKE